MLRSLIFVASATLVLVLWCATALASNSRPDLVVQNAATWQDPRFANGSIVIHVVEWPAFQSGPVHQSRTRGQSQAVLKITGRPLYDKVSGWMTQQPTRRIKNWGSEDRVGAEFVVDFLGKDGKIQKTYISNGCLFEDEAGNLYSVGPELRAFLEGLTAAGAVPGDCEGIDFEPEPGPGGTPNKPVP